MYFSRLCLPLLLHLAHPTCIIRYALSARPWTEHFSPSSFPSCTCACTCPPLRGRHIDSRTRNKLASVRGAETVRVAVYRQPPGVPPRSIWWTDAPTPSTGRPTRFTKFPPTTSSPNFFSLNIFILLSLSFSKCMKIIFERESIFDSSRDRRFLF